MDAVLAHTLLVAYVRYQIGCENNTPPSYKLVDLEIEKRTTRVQYSCLLRLCPPRTTCKFFAGLPTSSQDYNRTQTIVFQSVSRPRIYDVSSNEKRWLRFFGNKHRTEGSPHVPANREQRNKGAMPALLQLLDYGYYCRETSSLVYTDLPIALVHTANPPVMHVEVLEPVVVRRYPGDILGFPLGYGYWGIVLRQAPWHEGPTLT